MQVLLEQWIIVIFPYDKAIEKIVILIVFKKYIRINIFTVKCILTMLLLSSCSFFDYSVPEKEITQSSSWGPNDQPPSYPECESLDSNEQKKCFIESIEKKLIAHENFPIKKQSLSFQLSGEFVSIGKFIEDQNNDQKGLFLDRCIIKTDSLDPNGVIAELSYHVYGDVK